MTKEAMTLALEGGSLYETTGRIEDIDKCIVHRSVLVQALAKQEQGEHKESVRLECVVCKTVYEDGVPPQVAKQEQGEPLCTAAMFDDAFLAKSGLDPKTPLYTTPQPAQKPWVRLTDEDCQKIVQNFCLNVGDWTQNGKSVAIAIEAKLKEKNT